MRPLKLVPKVTSWLWILKPVPHLHVIYGNNIKYAPSLIRFSTMSLIPNRKSSFYFVKKIISIYTWMTLVLKYALPSPWIMLTINCSWKLYIVSSEHSVDATSTWRYYYLIVLVNFILIHGIENRIKVIAMELKQLSRASNFLWDTYLKSFSDARNNKL